MKWKLPLALAAVAGAGAFAFFNPQAHRRVLAAIRSASEASPPAAARPPAPPAGDRGAAAPAPRWDGLLRFDDGRREALGLATAPVKAQDAPSTLRLIGQTDYDPYTLTTIRPQYNCRVEKVHIREGSPVQKGDPLVDIFSSALAESKSEYRTKYIQWVHDKELVKVKRELASTKAISRRELIESENDESKSQELMKLAKDELLVYGLDDAAIEAAGKEVGAQKARFTICSPAPGIVIKRDVVPGNLYDTSSALMVIAPLDHLWVRGNVNEIDVAKVEQNQSLEVVFPYTDMHIPGKVEYIDKAIDPDTRAAKFRTAIPNAGAKLKSGMFVRVFLDIPPTRGRTVIPRIAMVSVDRDNYVFVRKGPGWTFERRPIRPWQEGDDEVIVDEPTKDHLGLKPGEEVVTTGSLILEQVFEDKSMSENGAPL